MTQISLERVERKYYNGNTKESLARDISSSFQYLKRHMLRNWEVILVELWGDTIPRIQWPHSIPFQKVVDLPVF